MPAYRKRYYVAATKKQSSSQSSCCFNTASGTMSLQPYAPGSRMATGLKQRFFTTSLFFDHFGVPPSTRSVGKDFKKVALSLYGCGFPSSHRKITTYPVFHRKRGTPYTTAWECGFRRKSLIASVSIVRQNWIFVKVTKMRFSLVISPMRKISTYKGFRT